MKNITFQIITITIITLLISAGRLVAGQTSQKTAKSNESKYFIDSTTGREINPEVIQKSINLYKNLSESQKTAIKEKMAKLAVERQKAIDIVSKQIREYRIQQTKQQNAASQQQKINQLQALQQLAIKENATATAKKLASLIDKFENIKENKSFDDNITNIE